MTRDLQLVSGLLFLADRFAWIGALSAAPNTKPPGELVPDPAATRAQIKLLYLSCGNKDGLINVSQRTHRYLKEHDVSHLWNVDDYGHDGETWGSNLYHFAQRVFRRGLACAGLGCENGPHVASGLGPRRPR
jgi:enterochelin esterase-like enzyme